ncbi:hypothetical protein [Catenibacterium mitsuokai]|uniref:hypothetical protein n=1 Tax=Catenibacterium mitsuokai TaxID=100886 RepID=UPI0022E73B1D|nr:hypothetical protein [Catenibacterium mitsuokai]
MKKWETPKAVEEQFTANSNVSVCYSLVCTLPGKNPYTEDGSSASLITESKVKDRGSIHSIWGEQTFRDLEKHDSNCALPARYNADTGVFKESGGNAAKVSNINIDKEHPAADGRYPAIWTSHYGLLDYHHMGYAVDDSVGHPLRS